MPNIFNCVLWRVLLEVKDRNQCQKILSFILKNHKYAYDVTLISLAIRLDRVDYFEYLLIYGCQKICHFAPVEKFLSSNLSTKQSLLNKFITCCNPPIQAQMFHDALNNGQFQILEAFSSDHLRSAAQHIDLTEVCNKPLIGRYPRYLTQLVKYSQHGISTTLQSSLSSTEKCKILYILIDNGASVYDLTCGTNSPLHTATTLVLQSGMYICLYNRIRLFTGSNHSSKSTN